LITDKKYTIDIYIEKIKRVIALDLILMTYKQAITFRSKFIYRKHYDYRIRSLNS
jgi:hypothetical protein